MQLCERLEVLAARLTEDTKAISHLLAQSTGLSCSISESQPFVERIANGQ